MKIILLGYMASGKSTIGRLLAEEKKLDFIDLDEYIEEQEEKTISDIFKDDGEIYFRLKEHEYLKELLEKEESFILSLGGGTPCYANNMELINSFDNVSSYYLKATPKTIKDRLLLQRDKRPLVAKLSDEELHEFIAKHLFERSFYYEQASNKIIIDDKSIEEVAKELLLLL